MFLAEWFTAVVYVPVRSADFVNKWLHSFGRYNHMFTLLSFCHTKSESTVMIEKRSRVAESWQIKKKIQPTSV